MNHCDRMKKMDTNAVEKVGRDRNMDIQG